MLIHFPLLARISKLPISVHILLTAIQPQIILYIDSLFLSNMLTHFSFCTFFSMGYRNFPFLTSAYSSSTTDRMVTLSYKLVDSLGFIIYFLCFSECQKYTSLSSGDRKETYGTKWPWQCDNNLGPGWFRFEGAAGSRMATTCLPYDRCDTWATGWLNGGHPSVADGQVTRQVCFRWGNCCRWSTNIKVRNCGSFYVYYLSGTPKGYCNLRYCSSD